MTEISTTSPATNAPTNARRMKLRYGFNEINGWWHFSQGPHSDTIRQRLRLMGTQVMRIFVFDQPVPDPVKEWPSFATYVQGVLDAGAVPMITFGKFPPPYDNAANIQHFVARCTDVVWGCIEQWGGQAVKDWYWCIWNEPNNLIIGGDLKFEQYLRIYNELSAAILPVLEPHLNGRKTRIGGPAIDGTHRGYWMDWIARLIDEADGPSVGFVSWHRYADWRPAVPSGSLNGVDMWNSPDPPTGKVFEALLMGQAPTYEARARGVERLVRDRDILNVCGELNAISHHEQYYTLGLNQSEFGGAYYVSALIGLMRGGADIEMRWTATAHEYDAYGIIYMDGVPTQACLAKQILAQHVRYGDWLRFPPFRDDAPDIDAVVAWRDGVSPSGVFVNTSAGARTISVPEWDQELEAADTVLRIDLGTGGRVVREPFEGTLKLDGYGVAIVTNNAAETVID
ncbi:MAG: hypothetical protein KTR19_07155 [Hyphomicrobiales bacterium]|nr:hypothetical protein [Hyphomicrobiales bacterium]